MIDKINGLREEMGRKPLCPEVTERARWSMTIGRFAHSKMMWVVHI
jgi:hypothetical protein